MEKNKNRIIKYILSLLLVIAILVLSACGKGAVVTEIELGENLPIWQLNGEHTQEKISDEEKAQGIIGIYTTESERADVYVYSHSKEGRSLEEFGQQLATEHNIFCNMMTDRDVPVAVLNYHECKEDAHYIVQAYIYEQDSCFLEICTLFKMEDLAPAIGDLVIRMVREYNGQEQSDSPLPVDMVYFSENDQLPLLRICQIDKNDLQEGFWKCSLQDRLVKEKYDDLSQDGWTLEDFISLYGESYDLKKGEIVFRNNLNLAFIGYVDNGIFTTRAFIDDGDCYIMLGAEAEAAKFQHVTNALIDAIGKN